MGHSRLDRQKHKVCLTSRKNSPFFLLIRILCRPAHKRINAVQFTSDSSEIVAADKFGDVYK